MIRSFIRKGAWAMLVLTVLFLAAACGSETVETFTVKGVVLASDDATDVLAGVTVSCAGTSEETLSMADGSFVLECPVPARAQQMDPHFAVNVWFRHAGHAPIVKGLIAFADETYAMSVVMSKPAEQASVTIPVGNTSIPTITGSMTISFEKDSMLDQTGAPISGSVPYMAASWDNTLPVEMDEGSGKLVQDAIFPAWGRFISDEGDAEQWLRPVAAGWFDPQPAVVNPEGGVDLQMFSQFVDDVVGRPLSGALDASLYLLKPEVSAFEKVEGAAIGSTNQISAQVDASGLWIWMVPQDDYACFEVTIKKGDFKVGGAQVTSFELFDDEKEKFQDEMIGSSGGSYCVKAVSGKSVRIQAVVAGTDGLLREERDLLSGGIAVCGDGCTPVTIAFPCEINEDCDASKQCVEGSCSEPEAV